MVLYSESILLAYANVNKGRKVTKKGQTISLKKIFYIVLAKMELGNFVISSFLCCKSIRKNIKTNCLFQI